MRFVNRTHELAYLQEAKILSKSKLFSLSVTGLRRVGKTRLLLEYLSKDDLYFFVNKDKETRSLLQEYAAILKGRKIVSDLEAIEGWDDFFKVLFERFHGVVVFDEFQNFIHADKSVFGTLQKYIDLHERRKGLLLIFSGSTVGLIKKLFSDAQQPLYGRLKRKLALQPFGFRDALQLCRELRVGSIENAIRLYALFGGFPKYYTSVEDEHLGGGTFDEVLAKLFFMENAILEDEAAQILSLEFGKRSGVYYDILAAIACGNTRMSEVAAFLRKKETALSRQMHELLTRFELVGIEKPITGGRSMLVIKHPLLQFWFRFFYKNLSSYKRREQWLIEKVRQDMNGYVGRRFEAVCREVLELQEPQFARWGKWWGAYREPETCERKTAEIDIVALNDRTNEILFAECKWHERVDAKAVLAGLKAKATLVNWKKGCRKEVYVICAKSFKERVGGEARLIDLRDMERLLQHEHLKHR